MCRVCLPSQMRARRVVRMSADALHACGIPLRVYICVCVCVYIFCGYMCVTSSHTMASVSNERLAPSPIESLSGFNTYTLSLAVSRFLPSPLLFSTPKTFLHAHAISQPGVPQNQASSPHAHANLSFSPFYRAFFFSSRFRYRCRSFGGHLSFFACSLSHPHSSVAIDNV